MKTLTPEELKRIEQLQLQIDWIKERFKVQSRQTDGSWSDAIGDSWDFEGMEYRRKPAPRFVPWTREDAAEFFGKRINQRGYTNVYGITGYTDISVFCCNKWVGYRDLLESYELDGTPCGKEEK